MSLTNNTEPKRSPHPRFGDLVLVKGFKYIVIRRAWLYAFLVLTLAVTAGFYGQSVLARELAHETKDRIYTECLIDYQTRNQLIKLVDASTERSLLINPPPGASPEQVQAYASNHANALAFQKDTHDNLALPDCEKLKRKSS